MAAAAHLIADEFFLLPGGIGIVVTAVVHGTFTGRGFFKQRRLAVKRVLTVLLVIIGAGYMGMTIKKNVVCVQTMLPENISTEVYRDNVYHVAVAGIIQIVGFGCIVAISVFKPWKKKNTNQSKNKTMKRILTTNWTMIPLFILTAYSGIGLHIAGHGSSHDLWRDRAVLHLMASILFLINAIFHIITHWNWYKGIVSKGVRKKNKITVMLSIVFLLVSVTGVILLSIDRTNSDIGLWHYKIGIITIIFSVGHILKRMLLFRKSKSPKRQTRHCAN